ncbi:hypothetical protein OFY17_09970 [Marinomonas sp. C2222]|uniref:YrhK domain-containing protein n=1 Tax=Marinomonas sargassi TaxID=2984494 RepID=A0ABT2YTH5_9GAMM|nr:hypothetical protein [Marinomonas sargassi]MCV2403204.1 hypothetical protein [Marinomonas sargassi]
MKKLFRKLFSPILSIFEKGEGEYNYKKSHRTILAVFGLLCFLIGSISLTFALGLGEPVGFIPVLLFYTTGLVCEVVAWLGTDRAVARIWKRN